MTSHFDPATVAVSRQSDWERAESFESFLDTADDNQELWQSSYRRARVEDELLARAQAIPGTWNLLVLNEDWCIDAFSTIPPLAALAEAASNLELRTLARDENLDLMDQHLTNGRSRSIPVVIVLDGDGVERGWWGPRPADIQAWVMGPGAELESADRYRELRKWYARDRGRMTIEEVLGIIERAAGVEGIA